MKYCTALLHQSRRPTHTHDIDDNDDKKKKKYIPTPGRLLLLLLLFVHNKNHVPDVFIRLCVCVTDVLPLSLFSTAEKEREIEEDRRAHRPLYVVVDND